MTWMLEVHAKSISRWERMPWILMSHQRMVGAPKNILCSYLENVKKKISYWGRGEEIVGVGGDGVAGQ